MHGLFQQAGVVYFDLCFGAVEERLQARRDDLACYPFLPFGPYFQLPPGRPLPAGGEVSIFGWVFAETHEQAEV